MKLMPSSSRELRPKDVALGATWFLFFIGPLIGTGLLLDHWVFHFQPHVSLNVQPHSTLYMILWFGLGVPLAVAGQGLWLVVMSRFVGRADVIPFIAYGFRRPRRVSRLDQALLDRFYPR